MQTIDPEVLGLSAESLDRAREMLERATAEGRLMGAALQVARFGNPLEPVCVGRRRIAEPALRVEPDTIFLVASITKPIVSAALMRLCEQGKLALADRVIEHVPEFGANGKEDVRLTHLLTHTSGLPDQIDLNREYRAAKRPLRDFVARICELPLLFEPGAKVSYQSCGLAIVGEIIERIERMSLRDYLRATFFGPLCLKDTSLGLAERSLRESDVKIAGEGLVYGGAGTDFDWNSDYWRGFGAPWGGLLTTVAELTTLMRVFLGGGTLKGVRVLSAASVKAMTSPLTNAAPGICAGRYGLGWRLQARSESTYGDLVSERAFGHTGATGTMAWADPETDVTCVLLTNDPAVAPELRARISNLVAGAVRG